MGADLIVSSFYTKEDWKAPEKILDLATQMLLPDDKLAEAWETRESEIWSSNPPFSEEAEQPSRADLVNEIRVALEDFFKTLDYRDVSWLGPHTNEAGIPIRQWITGGLSWGDAPTESSEVWWLAMGVTEHFIPGLLEKLGIYFTPYGIT